MLRGTSAKGMMLGMWDDFRYAWRRLRHQPGFAIAVIVVLALAVAAVTIVVAVAHAVILRPLPYRAADQVAVFWETEPGNRKVLEVSYRNYADWRANSRSFNELAAIGSVNASHRLTGLGEPTDVACAWVSASFFEVLGVRPERGRVLQEADDQRNAAPVTVISHGFWQQQLGGRANVIGHPLMLDGRSFEIVGVMPQTFDFPRGAEIWTAVVPELVTVGQLFKVDALESRLFGMLFVVGRLGPAVTLDQARRELDDINVDIDRASQARAPHSVVATSLEERLLGRTRPALLLLLGAVVLILVIATANIATLLMMRMATAQRETAMRLAIGASAYRLFRLWMAESVLLFEAATVCGIGVAWVSLPFTARLAPDSVYRIGEAALTPSIVVGVILLSLVAALLASALVALLSGTHVRLLEPLKESAHVTTARRLAVARRVLVTAEFALALLLLVCAGLTIRTFVNLQTLDLGFDGRGVLTVDVSPSTVERDRANTSFYAPLIERLTNLADIRSVGAAYQRPFAYDGVGMDTHVLPEGYAPGDAAAWQSAGMPANREAVTPKYFDVMRIEVREGRAFSDQDTELSEPVAILSEGAARRLFKEQPAVGRRLLNDRGPDGQPRWRTVVGVVADVHYRGLHDVRFDLYIPFRQSGEPVSHLVLRAERDPLQLVAQLRHEVRQIDPFAVVEGVTTMDAIVDRVMAPWRLYMVLFGVLGLLALTMATVGLYAVMRYAVVERWHELGIRSALGASGHQLIALVMRESIALLGVGIVIGVGISAALVRLMQSILFGVSPTDPVNLLGTAVLLAALAMAGAYVPTRAAGRADPATLMRSR